MEILWQESVEKIQKFVSFLISSLKRSHAGRKYLLELIDNYFPADAKRLIERTNSSFLSPDLILSEAVEVEATYLESLEDVAVRHDLIADSILSSFLGANRDAFLNQDPDLSSLESVSSASSLDLPGVHNEIRRTSNRILYQNLSRTKLANNHKFEFAQKHTIVHYQSGAVCSFIPKNACSCLRYSIGVANGCIGSSKDFDWIHQNNYSFNAKEAQLFSAPYSFVFLRNPFARLVSYYLDKICGVSQHSSDVSYDVARQLFGVTSDRFTFRDFVDCLYLRPSLMQGDVHIRPQIDFLIYDRYHDYFAVEDFADASRVVYEKSGLELLDVRGLGDSHTQAELKKYSGSDSFCDATIADIRAMRADGISPGYYHIYDDVTAAKVAKLYFGDIVFYCRKIKPHVSAPMWNWLDKVQVII